MSRNPKRFLMNWSDDIDPRARRHIGPFRNADIRNAQSVKLLPSSYNAKIDDEPDPAHNRKENNHLFTTIIVSGARARFAAVLSASFIDVPATKMEETFSYARIGCRRSADRHRTVGD